MLAPSIVLPFALPFVATVAAAGFPFANNANTKGYPDNNRAINRSVDQHPVDVGFADLATNQNLNPPAQHGQTPRTMGINAPAGGWHRQYLLDTGVAAGHAG